MIAMKSIISNETLNGSDLQGIYQNRFKGKLEYRNRVWNVLIRNYFQKYIQSGDTVLDLGAGYGEFINNVHCGKKYAIDLNPDTVHKVNAGVEVITQDCSTHWPLPDNSLDVVFTSNFFEHLPDEQTLVRTLEEIKRCLKPSGRIIAMGPNLKYLPVAYWDFCDHCLPLTEQSLSEALSHHGFHIEKCLDKFMPFTMANGPQYPAFFVSVYLHFPIVWRIFGKQFLIVATVTT
jgi:SAM-dependent methyltransferase